MGEEHKLLAVLLSLVIVGSVIAYAVL